MSWCEIARYKFPPLFSSSQHFPHLSHSVCLPQCDVFLSLRCSRLASPFLIPSPLSPRTQAHQTKKQSLSIVELHNWTEGGLLALLVLILSPRYSIRIHKLTQFKLVKRHTKLKPKLHRLRGYKLFNSLESDVIC